MCQVQTCANSRSQNHPSFNLRTTSWESTPTALLQHFHWAHVPRSQLTFMTHDICHNLPVYLERLFLGKPISGARGVAAKTLPIPVHPTARLTLPKSAKNSYFHHITAIGGTDLLAILSICSVAASNIIYFSRENVCLYIMNFLCLWDCTQYSAGIVTSECSSFFMSQHEASASNQASKTSASNNTLGNSKEVLENMISNIVCM